MIRRLLTTAVPVAAALWLNAGCGDEAASPDGDGSGQACLPGTIGCECGVEGFCPPGAFCGPDGTCDEVTCAVGSAGCACFANGTCDLGDDGALLQCGSDGLCAAGACDPGSEGCACVGGACLGDGLECTLVDGAPVCALAACAPGELGCTCPADWECDAGGSSALACDGARCVETDCAIGQEGCYCGRLRACDGALTCDDSTDRCVAPPCEPGTAGCECGLLDSCESGTACTADRCVPTDCVGTDGSEGCLCVAGSCDGELGCVGGVCRDVESIPEGAEGGSCLPSGRCNGINRCDSETFTCVSCTMGGEGCLCRTASEPCNAGLACSAGVCVSEESLLPTPPENPVCYTPCSEGLELPDGTFRSCSPQGLMLGCIGELSCVDGSCVGAGEEPATCLTDVECPDFQRCMSGRCYSECEFDTECSAGLSCFRKVCRVACVAGGDECGDSQFCSTSDGANGYCMPQRAPGDASVVHNDPTYAVSPSSLSFSNTRVSASFTITNPTDRALEFVVRKLGHTEYTDAGLVQVGYRDADRDGEYDDTPLHWVRMGVAGAVIQQQSFSVIVDAGQSVAIAVAGVGNDELLRWDGTIEVASEKLGQRRVRLEYSTRPDGQWSGTAYYFVNFDDTDIEDWLADVDNTSAAERTNNALLAKWAAFRQSSLFTVNELLAVISATTTGSWDFPTVRDACAEVYDDDRERICYLYVPDGGSASEASDGIKLYSADASTLRVPTGVVEMPFSMNLAQQSGLDYSGRINTAAALQYSGNPAVSLSFATDPDACARAGASCIAFIDALDAEIVMGGRYMPSAGGCTEGGNFAARAEPWVVPNFLEGTAISEDLGRIRTECRESTFPFDPAVYPEALELNASLAAANPLPDGRPRVRRISLLDGALINQETMVLLVKEEYPSFLGTDGAGTFSAYGIVVLRKATADLTDADYEPGIAPDLDTLPQPNDLLGLSCSDDLVREALGDNSLTFNTLTSPQAVDLARVMISGVQAGSAITEVRDAGSGYTAHYVCHDTGRINGGRLSWQTSADGPEPCPIGSAVTYFLLPTSRSTLPNEHACQSGTRCGSAFSTDACDVADRGTCLSTLDSWVADPAIGAIRAPAYSCLNDAGQINYDTVACDDDRTNLRSGKTFYVPAGDEVAFTSLTEAIQQAFRYKTRFRSRSGSTLGFVPAVCSLDADVIPYCYDPVAIEEIRERIDCVIATYDRYDAALAGETILVNGTPRQVLTWVREFLEENFSFEADPANPDALPLDGFERLYAELLIMLGDDAYTRSLASRFDLAGTAIGAFDGDYFEPNGIRLSGGAGFQMRLLYQAMQYHQLVLDRYFRLLPTIERVMASDSQNFVTIDMVATYLNRIVLASTKKAQVASELASLYQSFNRADLARHVIERSYAQSYLESVVLGQNVRRAAKVVAPESVPQVQVELTNLSLQYRVAMQRMRGDYGALTDELNYFGLSPDYIPFPALRPLDSDAVTVMLNRALESLRTAREREDRALESNRSFDTDAAQFQSELTRVRNQYEDQLADICGTFSDTDGRVYPAIPKYVGLNEVLSAVGDPCGLVGNGQIFQAIGDIDSANYGLKIAVRNMEEVLERMEIERQRGLDGCAGQLDIARLQYETQGRVVTAEDEARGLQNDISEYQRQIGQIDRQTAIAQGGVSALQAGMSGTVGGAVGVAAGLAAVVVQGVNYARIDSQNDTIAEREAAIRTAEYEAANLERSMAYEQQLRQCCLDASVEDPDACDEPGPLLIDSAARVDTILVEMKRSQLNAMRADLELQLAIGRLDGLRNQANRLIAQQVESEQLLINVEAARNDPNIRIYRNSAVIDADRTFDDALSDAYRATLVYEYYTTTTYARRDELFLARMVARGDYNLENYVLDLQRAFREFEELYGLPSTRVHVLSLRDDIFRIPMTDTQGRPLSQSDRTDLFREALTDVKLLDNSGVITIPLATSLEMTSPLTAAHKLLRLEAEIIGSDVGDRVGRVYLTPRGTSVVRTVSDERSYYRLPELTAVVNTYFNGVRAFDDDIYANQRLRDRPFVNSLWELGINQRDESVNEDINLNSLTDVRVYLFYTDFTEIE